MSAADTTLLVGLGSSHGDDAIGWRIADRIASAALPGVCVRRAGTPLDLLDWLAGFDSLMVCDACESLDAAGTVYDWRWPNVAIEPRSGLGSHDFGLVPVLQLAERLGRLPSDVRIYAVAGRRFQPGETLSPALEAALPAIVGRVMGDLRHARALTGSGAAETG
jgi:hydrogenase maturation protease